jgi:hypothetical protein
LKALSVLVETGKQRERERDGEREEEEEEEEEVVLTLKTPPILFLSNPPTRTRPFAQLRARLFFSERGWLCRWTVPGPKAACSSFPRA